MTLCRIRLRTPLGAVVLALRRDRICAVDFADRWSVVEQRLVRRFGRVLWTVDSPRSPRRQGRRRAAAWQRRFDRYFWGDVAALEGLALDLGGTPFQRAVWRALRCVPAGATTTYAALARKAGRTGAARAAGHAAALNPAAIVVPCHRAVGTDGTLHGYAGGLRRKGWLLSHEAQSTAARRR